VVDVRNLEYDSIFSNYQRLQGDYVLVLRKPQKEDVRTRCRTIRTVRWPDWNIGVEKLKKMNLAVIFSLAPSVLNE
jgi:hypothetical protein